MTQSHPSRGGPVAPPVDATPPPSENEPGAEAALVAPDAAAVAEQTVRAAVGAVVLVASVAAEAIRRTLPTSPPSDEPEAPRVDALALLVGAALGATVAIGEALATATGDLVRAARPVASWWLAVLPLGSSPHRVRDGLERLDARWRTARPGAEDAATALARELVPQIADAVLDQLDLTWLVAERVDLDALVERVDVDRIVARVDLDRVAAGIDVDAVVARVDLDRIVARIDVNEVAAGIDLDAIIARIDVAAIAADVIDELDIASLIRESTEAVTTESVRGIRVQSANADRYVQQVAARVLRRRAQATEDAAGDEPPSA